MTGEISFLSPIWLAGVPAVLAGLLYIYRRNASQRRRIVSSLLILKDFMRPSVEKAAIKLPVRFFLELAALSLLVLALAGIQAGAPPPRIAVIVDDSLSTRAETENGPAGHLIRRAAQQALSDLPFGALVDLYRTPSRRPVLKAADAGAVSDELNQDASPFHRDDLEGLIRTAGMKNYDRVFVFSDKEVSVGSLSDRLSFQSVRADVRRRENAAIERISRDEHKNTLRVTVHSFGSGKFSGSLEVNGVPAGLIAAGPDGSATAELAEPEGSKKVSVKLVPEDFDAIGEDNRAGLAARGTGDDPIIVVTELPRSGLGLEALQEYRFKVMTPAEYRSNNVKGRATIFHRYAPDELPSGPALFILPGDSKLFPTRGLFSDLSATRWDSSNPLTTYLHLDLLAVPKAQTFSPLPWQTVVLSSEEGPLLLAGERDGARAVTAGFELLPFQGRQSPLLSILTLNALKWLVTDVNTETPDGATFYAESDSDLLSNSIDLSFYEAARKQAEPAETDLLRTILLILITLLLTADMIIFIRQGRFVGARTA